MDLYMPDRDILQHIFVYRECCYSCSIGYPDDADLSFNCMYSNHNMDPVKNIMYAYKNIAEQDLKIKMFENICSMAKYGSSSKMPIRENPIFLTNAITNIRKYSPTAPKHILPALKDMLEYLKQDQSDVLVKSAMAHYQFEMIYPFDCYNGIIGRILIKKILLDANCAANYLTISKSLYEAKNDYFDLLSSTQMSGGYIRWIKFFTAIILNAAKQSRTQIEGYHQIVKQDEEKIRKSESLSIKNTLAIFEYWKKNLVSSITQSAKELELSYNTVERSVQLLQGLNILKQQSSTQRNRLFVYSELQDLFSS